MMKYIHNICEDVQHVVAIAASRRNRNLPVSGRRIVRGTSPASDARRAAGAVSALETIRSGLLRLASMRKNAGGRAASGARACAPVGRRRTAAGRVARSGRGDGGTLFERSVA